MGTLKAGAAKVVITPPIGVELAGYGYYLNRKSEGVLDDLYAKALVLDDGNQKVAIVATDLIGVGRDTTNRVRSLVEETTGIEKTKVLVAACHTHSGPATIFLRACGSIDPDYVALLPRYIAGAVFMASQKMKEARMGAGKGRLENISHNRVVKGGPIDPEVGVIRIEDRDGNVIATLLNFTAHAVALGVGNMISADFPGRATDLLERIEPQSVAMFLQGACGDINPLRGEGMSYERIGRILGAEALKVSERIELRDDVSLAARAKTIALPQVLPGKEEIERVLAESTQKLERKDLDERELKMARFHRDWAESAKRRLPEAKPALETEIQAIRIGDSVLAAVPCELFVSFGLEIKKRSPYANTLVVGYANDMVGYIPDEEEYGRGGYAASTVPKILDLFPFASNVGSVLVDDMLALIGSL